MRFDIVVANPPYHEVMDTEITGVNKATFKPIYHTFIDICRRLNPRYMSFIVPARWFSEGRNLDAWRETMMNDTRISVIVDFISAKPIFGRKITLHGGVCYFLWDSEKTAPEVEFIPEGVKADAQSRPLTGHDIIIRDHLALPIIEKVSEEHLDNGGIYCLQDAGADALGFGFFNMPTNFTIPPLSADDKRIGLGIDVYHRHGISEMSWDDLPEGIGYGNYDQDTILDSHKVILTKCTHIHGRTNRKVLHRCDVIPRNTATTGTYFIAGHFRNAAEALNLKAYLTTKFARFMISLRANTQHISQERLQWLPKLDYTKKWTDEALYKRYNLTPEEIAHIERTVATWWDAPKLERLTAVK